jgi:hypothetical protein
MECEGKFDLFFVQSVRGSYWFGMVWLYHELQTHSELHKPYLGVMCHLNSHLCTLMVSALIPGKLSVHSSMKIVL